MAITRSTKFFTYSSNKVMGLDLVTHDGSSTTVNLPVGTIEMAFVLQQVGTNSTGTTVSWSDSTVTFSAAGADGSTDYVLYVGTA